MRRLPPRLESYLSTVVRLTAAERTQLMSGTPITRLLDFDASKEVVAGRSFLELPARRCQSLFINALDVSHTAGAHDDQVRRMSSRGIENHVLLCPT